MPYPATNGNTHTYQHISKGDTKPTILHLGDPIAYNEDLHACLQSQFTIISPSFSSRTRPEFIQHLKQKTWGDFSAIMRPFWNTGGEMGRWNRELIELLPSSMQIMASAGAGFDWVDVDLLGEYGKLVRTVRTIQLGYQCTQPSGRTYASNCGAKKKPLKNRGLQMCTRHRISHFVLMNRLSRHYLHQRRRRLYRICS